MCVVGLRPGLCMGTSVCMGKSYRVESAGTEDGEET